MSELDFLKLPWEIQGALASGYAAYAIAYSGLRDRQRAIDVAFLSLVFSVPATLTFGWLAARGPTVSIPAAFLVAVSTAIIWRRFIRPFAFPVLKKLNITWANDDPSALATLGSDSKFGITQIAVLTDDGTWLRCDDARIFQSAPFSPYLLGPSGDVALYLTHEETAEGNVKTLTTVRDPNYGDRITYVPASRIRRITIRHKSRTSRPLKAAEAGERQSRFPEPPQASAAS